jgi:dTDP-4-dehydrorhamnose 3,5-epimerase
MQQKPAPTTEPFHPGNINDVIVRPLRKFDDRRGWLSELFRHDELPEEFFPVMSYISSTKPGVTRGPH